MHTIDAPRLQAVFSAEIVHLYFLSQFCCITNMKPFGYDLYFQSPALKSFFCLAFLPIFLFLYLFLAHLWQ